MNVRNCRKCGRIFNYVVGSPVCPACREALEADFQRVKEYIRQNRGATINQVSEECEVEISQIHQWLREERLELMEGSSITLQCETCGTAIMSGRYCDKCRRDLAMGLNNAVRPAQTQEPADAGKSVRDRDKMRFLNK